MRIAHLVAHRVKNGVSTSCKTLIDAQLRHGHEVLLITMEDAWLAAQPFDLTPEIEYSHMKTRIGELRRIGDVLRTWAPSVIHCHGSKANKYGMIYRILAGAPAVMTAHSRNIQLPPSFFRAVIAPSQQTADYHHSRNFVRKANMHVIPHLFENIKHEAAQGRPALRALGLRQDDFVIGIVGSVDQRKNQIDGVRTLKRLVQDYPQARLLLVGGASEKHAIVGWDEAVADPAVRDRIILAGHRDNAHELIAELDVLLCTSIIEEGPIVVLEAMALNVPVVSSNVGMVPTLIRDGIDGYVFEVGDHKGAAKAIGQLIDDPQLRALIGNSGRTRLASECDETSILNRIDAVYRYVARASGTLQS